MAAFGAESTADEVLDGIVNASRFAELDLLFRAT